MIGGALDPFASLGRRANDVGDKTGAGAQPERGTGEAANEIDRAFAGLSQMHRMVDGGDRGDPMDSLRAAKAELLRRIGYRRDGARAVPSWLRGAGIALTARGSAIRVNVRPVTPQDEREIAQIPRTVRPPGVGTRTPVLVQQVGDIAAQDDEARDALGGAVDLGLGVGESALAWTGGAGAAGEAGAKLGLSGGSVQGHGGPMRVFSGREASWDTGALAMNPAAMGEFAKKAGGKLGSMSSTSRSTASMVLGTAGEGLRNAGAGAGIGASIGSVIPGIGTVIGGALGAIGGAIVGVIHHLFGGGPRRRAAHQITAKERHMLNRGLHIYKTRHLPGAFQDAMLYIYNPVVYRRLRAQRRLPSEIEAQLLKKRAYAAHAAAIDRLYGARIRRELAHLPPELRALVGVSAVTGHARELYFALHRALAESARVARRAAVHARELQIALHRALAERARLALHVAPVLTAPSPEGPDAPALPEPHAMPGPEVVQESPHDPFRTLPLAGDAEEDADRAPADAGGVLDELAITLEQSRQAQRRYLRDSWVNGTWVGDFLRLDQPDDPSAPIIPAPSPGSGRPPTITLVPEPDTGDIVDDVYGKGLALARLRPFLHARRLQAVAPGDPLPAPDERVFNWSQSWDTREAFFEAFGRRFGGRVFDVMLARGWRFVEVVPESQDAGAISRTYNAQGDETPQAIARRYDALSRERWAAELKAANPQRDWAARIYAGDMITIPDAWPQPFWGAAKERGFLDASGPSTEEAGAFTRTYSAEGSETPQAIARRYDALARERWATELKAANPQRDWTARIYAGDMITIPDAWPQPFWGAAKERGFLDASGPTGELAVDAADPFLELRAQRARQGTFAAGKAR